MTNNWQLGLVSHLDETKSKNQLNQDIQALKKVLDSVELKAKLDPNQVRGLESQLSKLQVSLTDVTIPPSVLNGLVNQINNALQNINIGNIDIGNVGNQAQQVGQQIGNAISQGVANSVNGTSQATDKILRDFSKLNDAKRKFVDESELISKEDIADANKFYQTVREAFKEFGQVTISKGEITDGELESLRVKIQQVNGELKTTREFMLYLNQSSVSPDKVKLADDDTIKTTERMIQHLNEVKNITNATGDEANALKQKLAEQEKYYDKLEQASKEQLAIDKQRITAGEKQLEVLDKQSKRRDSRISYNKGQIDKKGLTDISRVRDINDMVSAGNEKYEFAFAKEIDKNISNLSKLKDKWKEQGVYVDEFKTKIETLENDLNNIDSGDVKGLNSIKQQMETLSKEADKIAKFNKIQLSTDITKLETDYKKFGIVSQEIENNLKELKLAHDAVLNAKGTDKLSSEMDKYNQKLAETKSSWKELTATQVSMNQRTSQMTSMQEWMRKNQNAVKFCGDEVEKLIQECRTCDKVRFEGIKREFKNLQVEAGKVGKLGNTFFGGIIDQGKKFLQWTGVTSIIMTLANEIRYAVDELKNLDDILTEISKTSDLTEKQLKELGNTAFESASKYGKNASEYLTGVQEMYRAGFDNASEMAELSLLAQAAGDMDANSANDYLIATNAAYDYKNSVEELNKVLDSQNFITNNSAIALQDMADATSEAGSIAAQYGVQIDELSALIAVAVSKTRESGSEVGTTLKSLFMNLQDTTSKPIREAFDAVGISMTKVVNGAEQLKTPIELIKELSVVFNQLPDGDIKKANILNDIAGKYNANTFAAILSDLNSYNEMLDLYTQGTGSAAKEAEKSANNWSGSLNKVKNSINDLVQNFVQSDVVIGGLNTINNLITGVDKLTESIGSLGTIGLGAGLFAGIKNVGINMLVSC